MSRNWIVFGFVSLLLSCVTVREAGIQVELVRSPEVVKRCQNLGEIESTSAWEDRIASGELRNAAGELGANRVLLTEESKDFWGFGYRGVAYRCPEKS